MFFPTLLIWIFSWNFWLGKCKMWPHLVSLTLFYFPVLVLLYWCLTLSNLQNNNPHHCSRSYSDVDYYFALYYRIYFLFPQNISVCLSQARGGGKGEESWIDGSVFVRWGFNPLQLQWLLFSYYCCLGLSRRV